MRRIVKEISKLVFPRYHWYAPVIFKNRVNNVLNKPISHKYLFILSPPFCGSTLLNEIISSSTNVSVNNTYGTREGQTLPTVRKIMYECSANRWNPNVDFDWTFIKNEWLKYWDLRKPVLLEKSPASIVRAKSLEDNFEPAYFIIFHRNPYAHCESLIRRNGTLPVNAANFAVKCLLYQKKNLELISNKIQISYEYLTDNPNDSVMKINRFVPEIGDINTNQKFSALNYMRKKMEIRNLNAEKINKLSFSQIKEINSVFIKNKEVIDFFNYELLTDNIDMRII